mgnify:CR=1 FL=1
MLFCVCVLHNYLRTLRQTQHLCPLDAFDDWMVDNMVLQQNIISPSFLSISPFPPLTLSPSLSSPSSYLPLSFISPLPSLPPPFSPLTLSHPLIPLSLSSFPYPEVILRLRWTDWPSLHSGLVCSWLSGPSQFHSTLLFPSDCSTDLSWCDFFMSKRGQVRWPATILGFAPLSWSSTSFHTSPNPGKLGLHSPGLWHIQIYTCSLTIPRVVYSMKVFAQRGDYLFLQKCLVYSQVEINPVVWQHQ